MRRLICAFVVRIWQKQVFSWHGSNWVKTRKWRKFQRTVIHHDPTRQRLCSVAIINLIAITGYSRCLLIVWFLTAVPARVRTPLRLHDVRKPCCACGWPGDFSLRSSALAPPSYLPRLKIEGLYKLIQHKLKLSPMPWPVWKNCMYTDLWKYWLYFRFVWGFGFKTYL